jgi:hypothetical protein
LKQSFPTKLLNFILDVLMLVVPFLELTELIAIIPPEYLPVYMLCSVLARRAMRTLEEYLASKGIE